MFLSSKKVLKQYNYSPDELCKWLFFNYQSVVSFFSIGHCTKLTSKSFAWGLTGNDVHCSSNYCLNMSILIIQHHLTDQCWAHSGLSQLCLSFCILIDCNNYRLGICKIYEEHLRQLHPHSPSITYDISELFKFVDDLHDLSCLMLVN